MTESPPFKWKAPAKLNLFLHITAQRPDGYHELQTLFQLLDFCDELEISPRDDGLICRLGENGGIAAEHDLVVRAARMLKEASGTRMGASIRVWKSIPMGSGLGGGSSNAATTLLVLNRLWNCGFTLDELARLGLALGADVPVFVHGETAMATGIGEILEPVQLGERHYVLVFMPVHISTAELFAHSELCRNGQVISHADALSGKGFNAFEPIVRKLYPDIDNAFEELNKLEKKGISNSVARMTGTGSAIFLPLPDAKSANKATHQLNSIYNVRAVRGQDRSPVHALLQSVVWTESGWQSAGTSPSW